MMERSKSYMRARKNKDSRSYIERSVHIVSHLLFGHSIKFQVLDIKFQELDSMIHDTSFKS